MVHIVAIVARGRCVMMIVVTCSSITILAIDVRADASRGDHLKTFGLGVEDLISHWKARNVPIYGRHNCLICISLFPLMLTARWWTSQRDAPRVDYSGHVLYRRQHGEDHGVLQVRPLLRQLALTLFRLRAPTCLIPPCILSSLGHNPRTLVVYVLQAVELVADGDADGGRFVPRSNLRLLAVMLYFLLASFQNTLTAQMAMVGE